jgi:hypothetical protein
VSKNGNPNMNLAFNSSEWLNVYPTVRNLANTTQTNSNISSINTCLEVPSTINVWFLYADAGKSNGSRVYEIVGSYVSYTYTDFSYVCAGSNQLGCQNNNLDASQDFEITFQSNFIKVTSDNTKWRYFKDCAADKYPSPYCLEEVFWLWPRNTNDPNYFYSYGIQLSLIFGVFSLMVFYVMVFGSICPC